MKHLFNQTPGTTTYFHDTDEGCVIEKVFDRDPVLEHAAQMRNEVTQTGELRKAMSIPLPLLYEMMATGELGDLGFYEGKMVIDQKTLQKLWAKFPYLRCMDRL